jgi:high-affinity Fe2+/Pb2+ permease
MESAQDAILRETVEAITKSLAALASERNFDRQQTIYTLSAISATAGTAVALIG